MDIEPIREPDPRASLIEDVVMPHAEPYTDVSRDAVRRRAIGNLQRQYARSRQPKSIPFKYVPSGKRVNLYKKAPRAAYSVVPPLRSLPDLHSGTAAFLPPLVQLPDRMTGGLASRLKRLGAAMLGFLFGWLPKRYTAASGLTPDWDTTAYRAKIAAPAILILCVLALLIYGIVTAPSRNGSNETDINPRTLPITVSNSGGHGQSGSASNPSGSPASRSSSGTFSSSTTSSTANSPLIGGRGGGPTTGTTSGTGSTSTIPLNLTTTLPPTDVQAGGKTLVNTSGTSLTVN